VSRAPCQNVLSFSIDRDATRLAGERSVSTHCRISAVLETRRRSHVKKVVDFTKIKVIESKSHIANFICTATDDDEDSL
jgi:hypothetical protein